MGGRSLFGAVVISLSDACLARIEARASVRVGSREDGATQAGALGTLIPAPHLWIQFPAADAGGRIVASPHLLRVPWSSRRPATLGRRLIVNNCEIEIRLTQKDKRARSGRYLERVQAISHRDYSRHRLQRQLHLQIRGYRLPSQI